jgi:4-hydroxy-3-polyprenylbenzoate decarboxylase
VPYYKDLREHIEALEANGKLIRIKREIRKETQLMPLVRWQFRGLPEEERKAFLFENVIDAKGKKYGSQVLVASHAASTEVYAIGMKCKPEEIGERWTEAQLHPVEPRIIDSGPVHEEVHLGDKLLEHGGLGEFPIPISTPGFDNAPYLTCANWVSKDPETGMRNMGNYRAMVKDKTRLGVCCLPPQHIRTHWDKWRARGEPMPAAAVVGSSPNVAFAAVTKVAYGVDEYAIAGGIAGEPVELVKCKTVDIEVPATAEIVIEGLIPTDSLEREGCFGEHEGYMGMENINPYFNVTCITHRKNAFYTAFISQFPPSESSKIRQAGYEARLYSFLKHHCGIPSIVKVAYHDDVGSNPLCVISLKRTTPSQPWQALKGADAVDPNTGKIIVAVDDDIEPRDINSVLWALCYRMQPHRDILVTRGKQQARDPSADPEAWKVMTERPPSSTILINATRQWDYPPVSLPRREFMEEARMIWEEEGLPALTPKPIWHGYTLGYWPEELEEEAEMALQGEHYRTGAKLAQRRIIL